MGATVRDVMSVGLDTIGPDATVTELDEMLTRCEISGAPVVDEAEQLLGVVSRADVVRVLYAEQVAARKVSAYYESPLLLSIPDLKSLSRDSRKIADNMTTLSVREIMTVDPETVTPDQDLREVAWVMSANKYHRLPVVDGDRLVGIVSTLDLVRALAERGLADA